MSLFLTNEEGYYSLTTTGTILFVLITAALIASIPFLKNKESETKPQNTKVFSTRQLVFSAVAIALGFAASYIRIVSLPWGGDITLCSMLFITLVGYWYGPRIGLIAGFSYSILQFLQDGGSYILSPLQVCMDYIFAFTALGLSGLFYRKANGLLKGYLLAIFVRGLFHTVGGYLYWMDYMPESFPKSLSSVYSIVYNYSYILAEGAITVIILMLPPVKDAMARIKRLALS